MDKISSKPRIEQTFQSEIYRSMNPQGEEEYRVVIGRYGTEVPPKIGEFLDFYSISDFFNSQGIDDWVREQVEQLKKEGKKIGFDVNLALF